jgi:hypothetical protein
MRVRDYDPREGQAFQGDVAIIPIPSDIPVVTSDEIAPIDGRLIIQQGELTGHHHAIYFGGNIAWFRDDGLARDLAENANVAAGKLRSPAPVARARFYRDANVAQQMLNRGLLTRSDLAIGCLVVESGSVVVSHEEHDGIRLPVGNYLIGRQIESAGAEQHLVHD